MKKRVVNPYLPSYEYVPDGEPHVFDGRLYIFGSHDRFGSKSFCANDYTCWSAPCDDLSDWRCEGIIYRRSQDPMRMAPLRMIKVLRQDVMACTPLGRLHHGRARAAPGRVPALFHAAK